MASGASCTSLISQMDTSNLSFLNVESSLRTTSEHITSIDLTISTYSGSSYIMGLIVNGQSLSMLENTKTRADCRLETYSTTFTLSSDPNPLTLPSTARITKVTAYYSNSANTYQGATR